MKVQIATPEKVVFDGDAKDVLLNAEKGQLNILEQHAGLVSFLRAGTVTLKGGSAGEHEFEVSDGILKVDDNRITLLCPKAESLAV